MKQLIFPLDTDVYLWWLRHMGKCRNENGTKNPRRAENKQFD